MSRAPRVTILSPHHDDAVLSAWSVLTGPAEVRVVNVFAGIPPEGTLGRWDRTTGASDSAERMRERRREDAEVLAGLGREPLNLDLLECDYRDGVHPTAAEVLAALEAQVDRDSVVYGPAGIGGHVDHVLVRSALAALVADGVDVRLYAELPYCAHFGWPGWVTGGPDGSEADAAWDEALASAELDLTGMSRRAVRLDSAAEERKRRALSGYRTQFSALTLTSSASRHVSDPDVLPFEAYWEPRGGAPVIAATSRS